SGEFYLVNPQFLFFKNVNPFKRSTRNSDIDFGSNQRIDINFQFTIPPSYEVVELPKSVTVRPPDTSFIFTRRTADDSTNIIMKKTLEIRRPEFEKENYQPIKEFFTRAYALMSEEILIRKKK